MKLKHIYIILIITIGFISCEKDDNTSVINYYSGNDIDSVARNYINSNGDTVSQLSLSCGISSDRNTITFKAYDYSGIYISEIYNIINNRLETTNEKLSTKTVSYFNHNKFLTLSVYTFINKPYYDSTFYIYNNANQLYQTKRALYYGKNFQDSLNRISKINTTDTYYWSNENIVKIQHDDVYTFDDGKTETKRRFTNFEYSNLENPLDYFYGVDPLVIPFIRMGRACKNLVSRIEHGQTSTKMNYTYELSPNNNSILIHEKSDQSTGTGTIYEYHY